MGRMITPGPKNELDMIEILAKKYCANDPELDQLIAEKNSGRHSSSWEGRMLKKIADALEVHVENFRAACPGKRLWKSFRPE